MDGMVTIPISARVELDPDGQFKMVSAEFGEVSATEIAALLYPAYIADRQSGLMHLSENSKEAL